MKTITAFIYHSLLLLILSFVPKIFYSVNFDVRVTMPTKANMYQTPYFKNISSLVVDSFIGVCDNKEIVLKWIILSENANYFATIEKSYNAIDWKEIGVVNSVTSYSEKKTYTFTDSELEDNISYYRLKHSDYSGGFYYSKIIDVNNCYDGLTENTVMVYPNPSKGLYNLSVSEEKYTPKSVEIFNHLGEKIYRSDDYQRTIDLSGNPGGLYYAHINFNEKIFIKKIVIDIN